MNYSITIRSRTGAIMWVDQARSVEEVLARVVKQGRDMSYAFLHGLRMDRCQNDLDNAQLYCAFLSYSDLSETSLVQARLERAILDVTDMHAANLENANLRGANIRESYLVKTNLKGADLSYANLTDTILDNTTMENVNIRGAILTGARLRNTVLTGTDLRSANLRTIRVDFHDVLLQSPREVPLLIEALKEGRVDGLEYYGRCACLIGTLANAKNVDYRALEHDASRPIERFFMAICEGDTPKTNQVSDIVVEWAERFIRYLQKA